MTLCASCGATLNDSSALCPHHGLVEDDGWAVGNRILCDLFHRGREPVRVVPDDRETFPVEAL